MPNLHAAGSEASQSQRSSNIGANLYANAGTAIAAGEFSDLREVRAPALQQRAKGQELPRSVKSTRPWV
jgi:hypothetical protein